MARARLTEIKQDVINDGGAVLWSFVKGEQLEFPITLQFLTDSTFKGNPALDYQFEAVVVEALNVPLQEAKPTTVKVGGVQTTLTVRVPLLRGTWSAATAYNKEDIVFYTNKYYKLISGVNRVSATTPDIDPLWAETARSIIYVQFPSTLGSAWSPQPEVNDPRYGFFELRVTEPTDVIFTRTFKPVRGMVEILFSPTDVVADV